MDSNGNLYGTTTDGNTTGNVFKLTPSSEGEWTETVLYAFGAYPDDGILPYGALAFDSTGNLYGTTLGGGASHGPNCAGYYGCGTVFMLSPSISGLWNETILHNFAGGADGSGPESTLVFDRKGDLFGTTVKGGDVTCDCGSVFELAPTQGGPWHSRILHAFNGLDGSGPVAGVVFDPAGNLYGTTADGGLFCLNGSTFGCGNVFRLSRSSRSWAFEVLHEFGRDTDLTGGANPFGGVVLDVAGNLYGTTALGGGYGFGTVFELKKSSGYVMDSVFDFSGSDGSNPVAAVTLDGHGHLYGTTPSGGFYGAAFEIIK